MLCQCFVRMFMKSFSDIIGTGYKELILYFFELKVKIDGGWEGGTVQ